MLAKSPYLPELARIIEEKAASVIKVEDNAGMRPGLSALRIHKEAARHAQVEGQCRNFTTRPPFERRPTLLYAGGRIDERPLLHSGRYGDFRASIALPRSIFTEMQEQELAAPAHATDARTDSLHIASRRSSLPRPGIQNGNAHDAPPTDLRSKRTRHCFNFREFRHREIPF